MTIGMLSFMICFYLCLVCFLKYIEDMKWLEAFFIVSMSVLLLVFLMGILIGIIYIFNIILKLPIWQMPFWSYRII